MRYRIVYQDSSDRYAVRRLYAHATANSLGVVIMRLQRKGCVIYEVKQDPGQ